MKKTKVRSKSVGIRLGSFRYDMRLLFFYIYSCRCRQNRGFLWDALAWGLVKNGAPTRQQQIPENGSNF